MNVGLKFCFVDVVQKSFHVGQSCQFGITPQLFEIIIFPRFGLEDMYIDMTVIDNNPLRVFVSVVVKRFYTDFTFPLFLILHSDFTMQLWLRDGEHESHDNIERNKEYS